jgi:hypothetical protein
MVHSEKGEAMRVGGITALSIYGLSLIGGALVLAARAPADDKIAARTETCIRGQFVDNGFKVSSSGANTTGGTIIGNRAGTPPVAVFFKRDDRAVVRIGDLGGRYSVLDFTGGELKPIQSLTEAVAANCLKPAASKKISSLRLG